MLVIDLPSEEARCCRTFVGVGALDKLKLDLSISYSSSLMAGFLLIAARATEVLMPQKKKLRMAKPQPTIVSPTFCR